MMPTRQSLALLTLASRSVDIVYAEETSQELLLRGWRPDESLVALRSTRDDDGDYVCGVVAITATGAVAELASMSAIRCTNAAVDISRRRAFYAAIVDGIRNFDMIMLDTGDTVQLTSNTLPNIGFAAPWVLADGRVLFSKEERHHDVWLSRVDE